MPLWLGREYVGPFLTGTKESFILHFASLFVPCSLFLPFLVIKACWVNPLSLGKKAFIFLFHTGTTMDQNRFPPYSRRP